jgi:hypothetical protein
MRTSYVPRLAPLIIRLSAFLCVYVKDQVYSQRLNTPDELKARITAAVANVTTDMLQRFWHEVDCRCRWDVRRNTDCPHCEAFRT